MLRWPIGMMAWRIGDTLEIDAQIRWIREAGFDALGFHAAEGEPDRWQGVAPAQADRTRRAALRQLVQAFAGCEIHAPFAHTLAGADLGTTVERLLPSLDLAADVGTGVVTIHAQPPATVVDWAAWERPMAELNQAVGQRGLRAGLEITEGYDWLLAQDWPYVGVTLDVGHMVLNGGALARVGGFRQLIGRLGARLVHLHLHDYNGVHDHIALGEGSIDFASVLAGLADIAYGGMLCLELNPDRVSPEQMVASLHRLRDLIAAEPPRF